VREISYDVKEIDYDEKEYIMKKNYVKESARALSLSPITLTAYPTASLSCFLTHKRDPSTLKRDLLKHKIDLSALPLCLAFHLSPFHRQY